MFLGSMPMASASSLVDLQHPLLTVEGNEELGLGQGVDDLQLLLAGVAGHVEHIRLVVHHVQRPCGTAH